MQPYQQPIVTAPPALGVLLVRTSLSLLVVLVLIYALTLALRRWGGGTRNRPAAHALLRLLQTLPLGGGRFLHLVAIGSRVIVISAAGTNSALIVELAPDEAAALAPSPSATLPGVPPSLTSLIHRMQSVRGAEPTASLPTGRSQPR